MVRHGEMAWNAEGRVQGRTDVPLSEVGSRRRKRWCRPWPGSASARSIPRKGRKFLLSLFDLKALQEFAADKRVRKALAKGGQIDVEMARYEPGQSTPMHAHPRQDEIFYIVEGRVNMSIGGTEQAFDAGAMSMSALAPRTTFATSARSAARSCSSSWPPAC